jgi:class II flagellar assembly regulator FliX
MRIQGPIGTAAAAASGTAARRTAAGGTFSLSEASDTRAGSAATALRSVGSIDALIALQGVEDPTERRKRAVRRGRLALDALDELKIGILGGTLAPATLSRLKSAAAALKDASGEAGLDGVLGEIELRVEVEIAKMTPR